MKHYARKRMELSAIFLCAALLITSLMQLSLNIKGKGEHRQASAPADPFPELYASSGGAMQMDAQRNIVYLTFDDGPSPNTERLLDILKKHNAKATFFVTAQEWEEDYLAGMYERIVEEGHTLGLHSYSHEFDEIYASPSAYLKDIDRLRALIEQSCGYRPSIMRFPGGSTTSHASKYTMDVLIEEMGRRGYLWYDWDIPTGDDKTVLRRAEDIAQTIIEGVEGSDMASIVLCHDSSTPKTTPDAIEIVLVELSKKGYEFKALPSYHVAAPQD